MREPARARAGSRARLLRQGAHLGARVLALSGVLWVSACYTVVPVSAPPAPGRQIVVEVTDAGRVQLGDQLGPELRSMQGTLVSAANDSLVLNVSEVNTISGGNTIWSGETVTVRREYVKSVSERRLSHGKSLLAIGGVAAAVALMASQNGLFGSGSDRIGDEGGDSEDQ